MHLIRTVSPLAIAGFLSVSAQNNPAPAQPAPAAAGVRTNAQPLTVTNFVASPTASVSNGIPVGAWTSQVPPTSILGTNIVVKPLTLGEAITLALENNYALQIARITPEIRRFDLAASTTTA